MYSHKNYPCPCCGYLTLSQKESFEICMVCYWQDDGLQAEKSDYEGGANQVSLNQARSNFNAFGASEEVFLDCVRKPLPEEMP